MYATNFLDRRQEMQTKVVGKLQIFDLLQLSRKEKETKELCLQKLEDLRDWKKILPMQVRASIAPSVRIRSVTLRREAREAIKIYKLVRESRIKLFKNYMDDLPPIGNSKRLAS